MTRPIHAILLLALLSWGQAFGQGGPGDDAEDPWDIVAPTNSSDAAPQEKRTLERRVASRVPTRGDSTSPPAGGSWLRTFTSLASVLGLIGLVAWGYRVAAGRAGGMPFRGRAGVMEIIARSSLAPKQSLCLVRVGPRLLLLGVGPERVTTLEAIREESEVARLLGEAARGHSASHVAEFNQCLEREARTYEPRAATPTGLPDGERVLRVRSALDEAVQKLKEAKARERAG